MKFIFPLLFAIAGIIGIMIGIPFTLVFVLFGIAGIVQYVTSPKKKNLSVRIFLILGIILLFVSLLFWLAVLLS